MSFVELSDAFLSASVPTVENFDFKYKGQLKNLKCVTTSPDNKQYPAVEVRTRLKEVADMPIENQPVLSSSRGDFMIEPKLGLIGNDYILSTSKKTNGWFNGVTCDNHVVPSKYIFSCQDTKSADEFGRGETDVAITTFISTPQLEYSTLKIMRVANEPSLKGLLIAENSRLAKNSSLNQLPDSIAGKHRKVVSYEVCQVL